jgi:Glycosyltransferase family 10 (fucosyltransferase) C-term
MIKIKLTTESPDWPLIRQTPGSEGIWGNCQFYVNQDVEKCDYWVVCNGLVSTESTICPIENTMIITWEPPAIKTYHKKFISQFGAVITCHQKIKHPNVIYTQQGLPWMAGGRYLGDRFDEIFSKDYDELKSIREYDKSKLISVTISSKSHTVGHAKRLKFVERLKAHFGNDLDVFGVGIKEVPDKWDAIAEYKYHIVVENSSILNYWTEKLSDAFLGGAYPFYFGCPNLSTYFPEDSFVFIDINNWNKSVELIEKAIKNQKYERSVEKIMKAKNLVLEDYNIFALISSFCTSNMSFSDPNNVSLKSEHYFIRNDSIVSKLLNMIKIYF